MQKDLEKENLNSANKVIKGILIGSILLLIAWQFVNFETNIDNKQENQKLTKIELNKENTEEEILNKKDFDHIFIVKEMPKYKGCESLDGDLANDCTMLKVKNYVSKVDYPQFAVDNNIEGKVYIRFTVGADGIVSEVALLKGVDDILDNAAINHIKKMPKFATPGKERGKAVKVQYSIPIIFKLD